MENQSESKSSKRIKRIKKTGIKIPPLDIGKRVSINENVINTERSEKKLSLDPNLYEKENIYNPDEKMLNRRGNEIRKFENIYSPRTTFVLNQEKEDNLYFDLGSGFDPITIKIMKSFFKERLGELDKQEFIGLLKNNLLTEDIDLNNNFKIDWEEFTNFIINASDNKNNRKNYELKYFIPLKKIIDDSEFVDIVSHAFYIAKYNLIGIAIEGKSYILFYDADTCKKLKTYIDVKETQQRIDKMKYKELEQRALVEFIKKEEEKRIKIKNNFNLQKLKNINLAFNETAYLKNRKNFNESMSTSEKNLNTLNHKQNRDDTPEKLREELKVLNADYFQINKKDFNKKLTILCTVFVEEYDTLFISSSK